MSPSSISSSFKGEDKEVHKLLDNRDRTYSMSESSVSEKNHHEGHLCSPPGQLCYKDGRGPEPKSGWAEASARMGARLWPKASALIFQDHVSVWILVGYN